MRITFWSPIHGQATVTSNMVVIALLSGIIYKMRCIMTQTQFNNNNLEAPLVGERLKNDNSEDYFRGTGIDALIRNFKAAQVKYEDVENCCISFPNTNVSLLPGTAKNNKSYFDDEMNKVLLKLLAQIDSLYDFIFLDVNSGANELSKDIMLSSDLVVVNLPQNIHVIEEYMSCQDSLMKGLKGDIFYLIGNYDNSSRYNISNLRRRYHKYMNKNNSGVIPHNTLYLDSQNDSRVVEFIKDNVNCREPDCNYYFMKKAKSATRKIINNAMKTNKKGEMQNGILL